MANNTVDPDPSVTNYLENCTGVNMYFNYDLNGNPRADLNTLDFSTITPFGIGLLASPNNSAALVSLGLPANPAVLVTNNQSQPVTFNTNVTVNGTLNYSNMVAQLLAGIGVTTSTLNTPTGQVVTVNANAQTRFNNEVWISPVAQPNGGNGTLDFPYDGSTQAKFDTVMGSLRPSCTVHLLAGTYQTYGTGAWNLQSGQKILGSGIDNTIVKLVPNAGNGTYVCAMGVAGKTMCSNIVVADLTVDAGFTSNNFNYDGIYLAGSHNTIRKVKVINFGEIDNEYSANSYGILIGYCAGMGANNCEGNLVENCEIGPVLGDGGDGIVFNGGPNNWISRIIRNNRTSSSIKKKIPGCATPWSMEIL